MTETLVADMVIADCDSSKLVNTPFRQIYLQFPYFKKELKDCNTFYGKFINGGQNCLRQGS